MDPIKSGAIFRIRDVSVLRITMPRLSVAAAQSQEVSPGNVSEHHA